MKRQSWTRVLTAGTIAIGATTTFNPPSHAQSTRFVCSFDTAGIPTTYAQTPRGAVPVVKWVSEHFSDAGFTPERRCQEVSSRFNSLYSQGRLNYLSAGLQNGQSVICALGARGGECTLLYTLKAGQDASIVLQRLRAVQTGAAGPLYESTRRSSDDAIDLNQYLNSAPVEQMSGDSQPAAAPAAPSVPSAPSAPASQPGGGSIW